MTPRKQHEALRFCAMAKPTALLLISATIAACSNIAVPQQQTPATTMDPAYGALIATYIKRTFKTLPPVNTFEISSPRWVHATTGWSWLACVRFRDGNALRSYSVFLQGTAVTDARYAVETDDCPSQAYSPFNLDTGAIGSTAVERQSPLY